MVFLFGVGALILAGLLFCVLGTACLGYRTFTPLGTSRIGDEMVTRFAAESLDHGQNPYAWDALDIFRVFRDQAVNTKPFLDGAFQNRVNQPALPILFYSLTRQLGADFGQGTVRTAGLTALIVLLVLIFLGSPEPVRPIVLLPLFVFREPLFSSLSSDQEIVWRALCSMDSRARSGSRPGSTLPSWLSTFGAARVGTAGNDGDRSHSLPW